MVRKQYREYRKYPSNNNNNRKKNDLVPKLSGEISNNACRHRVSCKHYRSSAVLSDPRAVGTNPDAWEQCCAAAGYSANNGANTKNRIAFKEINYKKKIITNMSDVSNPNVIRNCVTKNLTSNIKSVTSVSEVENELKKYPEVGRTISNITRRWHRKWIPMGWVRILSGSLALLVYLNTLPAGYVYDDQ